MDEEQGTPENPFDTIPEGIDACDGSGKVIWVDDPEAWNLMFPKIRRGMLFKWTRFKYRLQKWGKLIKFWIERIVAKIKYIRIRIKYKM